MTSDQSPAEQVPIDAVPAQLAALRKNEFPWFRTPVLEKPSTDMRALCMAVMRALEEDAGSPGKELLRDHPAVSAEIAHSILLEGVHCMTGRTNVDGLSKSVAVKLDVLLRKNGDIPLEERHPFENDPSVVSKKTVASKSAFTGRTVQKTKKTLNVRNGYQDAVKWLQSNGHIRHLTEARMPELLAPSESTVRSLPRALLAVLEKEIPDDDKRHAMIKEITDYCDNRYGNMEPLITGPMEKYLMKDMEKVPPEGTAEDDYMIVMFKKMLDKAGKSREAEKELRIPLMVSLIAMANEGQPMIRSNGREFDLETILKHIVLGEWPKIFDHYGIPVPPEAEMTALATIARTYPMDDVKKTVQGIERPPAT